jgi:hypothetical protein
MAKKARTPLKITCTSSDCDSGLHCFKATTKMKARNEGGRCRECGADLIAWERLYSRDLQDVEHTFKALKHELIRHHFWHKPIDQKAINHARRKGKKRLHSDVAKRIRRSLGAAKPERDGRQTPLEDNVIYYAQHATASCCRRCAEYWHGIPMGRPLADGEIEYLSALVRLYIDERLPRLTEDGEYVSQIRSKKRAPAEELDGKRVEVRRRSVPDRSLQVPSKRPTNREHPGEVHQH